jgi:hypothetical protein
LRPPAQVQAEHDELVTATESFYSALASINTEIQAIQTNADLQEYLSDSNRDLNDAVADVSTACLALQAAADENEIDADLACGEPIAPEDPTNRVLLELYFTELKSIFDEADTQTEAAESKLNEQSTSAPLGEQIAAIDEFASTLQRVFQDAVDSLENMGVPTEAQEDHDEFIASVQDAAATISALQEDLPGIETAEQLQERLDQYDADATAAVARADAACFNLQDIADEDDIDIDLECEG